MAWTWEFMVLAFNAIGGKIDNIARKSNAEARGIIPVDPEKPVRLYAPVNLNFSVSDVEFRDGRLGIKDGSSIGQTERSFFENYYESFSWAGGAEAITFQQSLEVLPADIHALLSDLFGIDIPGGEESRNTRAELWFLQSRLLHRQGKAVLVPVLDLVNHGPRSNPYGETNGVTIAGTFSDEVLALRGRADPFGSFWKFGFASADRVAFSLPISFETESGFEMNVGRNVNVNSELGGVPVPDFEIDGRKAHFSCLMIGNSGFPRLSRGIFCRIMRDAGEANPDQVFDSILHRNRLAYLRLLETLEPFEGGLVPELRKVARLQLEAMSWCIGAREL